MSLNKIAHDIKNNLCVITLSTELLQRRISCDELDDILKAADRIDKAVEGLMENASDS